MGNIIRSRRNNNKRFQPQILRSAVFAAAVDLFIYRKPFRANKHTEPRETELFDLSAEFNLPQVLYAEHIQIYGVMMSS